MFACHVEDWGGSFHRGERVTGDEEETWLEKGDVNGSLKLFNTFLGVGDYVTRPMCARSNLIETSQRLGTRMRRATSSNDTAGNRSRRSEGAPRSVCL